MCGIFGLSISRDLGYDDVAWSDSLARLFKLSESRGKEAAGIAVATKARIEAHKDSVSASQMLATEDYRAALDRGSRPFFGQVGAAEETLTAIGHARLVTNGLQGIDANNQPVRRDDVVIVHNGIVVNVDTLWRELASEQIQPRAQVDTEVIAAILSRSLDATRSPAEAIQEAFSRISGESSVAILLRQHNILLLATNTGSLHYATSPEQKGFVFASEATICRKLTGRQGLAGFSGAEVRQLAAGWAAILRLDTLGLEEFSLDRSLQAPSLAPMLASQRRIEDKAERYEEARRSMRRCTRCLLPETMPYIAYDAEGVCNYCHNYRPWVRKPEIELEQLLDRYRTTDGSPDCVMAFSGGRDSSYGLHLLKNKYGMKPLCFSYDWGMVTDLARRNQARMAGALGVEHIWVSADIRAKRSNIRSNVLAWLKKPDLGLVPLFMAGDKQVLWHANRIMRETGIPVMVFCTNQYEKTEFKSGFLGVRSLAATIHKPSTLPSVEKAKMVMKYGVHFLRNPAYLNRSLPDTLTAFFSYYALEQNYFSLFDHVSWDEAEIDRVLINDYDWETAPDSKSTWRIGDGTAPFYNYIYYSVAGFTEFDTFRSNQIRQGVLGRAQAAQLVEEENRPRWQSIREYTQLINIDFDETIRTIDRIPKLYAH